MPAAGQAAGTSPAAHRGADGRCSARRPVLHTLVPQMVDSVVEVLRILHNTLPDVEQVIEVPKIILHTVPQRSSLLEPQTAEQLVEVPDTVSLADGRDEAAVPTGGWSAPTTLGRTARRIHCCSVASPAVDVPMTMLHKFQQFVVDILILVP